MEKVINMYNLFGLLLFGCIALNVTGSEVTLEDRDKVIWRSSKHVNDTSIRPARITFGRQIIKDLRYRLNNRRKVTPPLEGIAFQYGVNTDILDFWADYWANKYNFTEREAYFNQYPMYKTNIQGLDIQFIWIKPQVEKNVKVLPLMLLHGFPGSIREFYDSIPLLTNKSVNGIALELIIPFLPGFGFSEGATRPGFGPTEIATVFKNLMKRLGFNKFYVQAGDMGAYIATMMITLYQEECLGFHTNYAVSYAPCSLALWFAGSANPSSVVAPELESRMYPLSTIAKGFLTNSGYLHHQATKPDTIGVAMADSAIGLLSYILTLFAYGARKDSSTKPNGNLELFTPEEILDDTMMYWVPNSFTTSARIYAEYYNIRNIEEGIYADPTSVPMWTTHTKNEIHYQSPAVLKCKFTNILNSTVYDDYGHFFALEAPEVFTESVWTAMVAFEEYHSKDKQCRSEL